MQLPAPIQTYFDADQELVGAAPIQLFTQNAIVRDEGKTHIGHDAITAWWIAAKAKYQHKAEPCELSYEPHAIHVRAKVMGQFPGSPALLTFAFQLDDKRIAILEITA